MGKVETDTWPKNGLCYQERPIFIHSLCDLLFLLQSMLVLLSEVVNMDDIERSNVNQFYFSFKQRRYRESICFRLCSLFCKSWSFLSPAITCESELKSKFCENYLRQFAVSRLCDIFSLILYQHALEGSHHVNGPSSLN